MLEKRQRCWLEKTSQRTGMCMEVSAGERPGTLTLRLLNTTSSGPAGTFPALCPDFTGQQRPPCRGGNSKPREHNAVVGASKNNQVGLAATVPLVLNSASRPTKDVIYFALSVTADTWLNLNPSKPLSF